MIKSKKGSGIPIIFILLVLLGIYLYLEAQDRGPTIIDISIDQNGCGIGDGGVNGKFKVGDIAIWYNTGDVSAILILNDGTQITIPPREDYELKMVEKGVYSFYCNNYRESILIN